MVKKGLGKIGTLAGIVAGSLVALTIGYETLVSPVNHPSRHLLNQETIQVDDGTSILGRPKYKSVEFTFFQHGFRDPQLELAPGKQVRVLDNRHTNDETTGVFDLENGGHVTHISEGTYGTVSQLLSENAVAPVEMAAPDGMVPVVPLASPHLKTYFNEGRANMLLVAEENASTLYIHPTKKDSVFMKVGIDGHITQPEILAAIQAGDFSRLTDINRCTTRDFQTLLAGVPGATYAGLTEDQVDAATDGTGLQLLVATYVAGASIVDEAVLAGAAKRDAVYNEQRDTSIVYNEFDTSDAATWYERAGENTVAFFPWFGENWNYFLDESIANTLSTGAGIGRFFSSATTDVPGSVDKVLAAKGMISHVEDCGADALQLKEAYDLVDQRAEELRTEKGLFYQLVPRTTMLFTD